jgi:ABC-type sugar transport system ATPase subunit
MDYVLEMKGISKSFFGVEVLHQVDFNLKHGEVVALCGENGAGKSTLMKILAAAYERSEGTISLFGNEIHQMTPRKMLHEGVSMIHQELNLLEDLTVAQNIYLTREPLNKIGLVDFPKMNSDAKALLDRLGQLDIKPTAKVYTLKIAQKQMVEIAKSISFDAKILIMDEPTAVLTLKETDILFELIRYLTARGIGIIYVTHRLSEVKALANRVTVLRDGHLVATKDVVDVSEDDIAAMMVGRMVEHTIPDEFAGDPKDLVLEVRNMTGDILKNVSFSVARGEILGFSGLVGAGRSELMEMIFGLRKFDQGEVLLHGKPVTIKTAKTAIHAGLGFATEDRKASGLVLQRSISENADLVFRIKSKKDFILSPKNVKSRTQKMINRLRIVCRGPNQLTENLSGGNQQKVVLAKWLLAESDIFIVDEPTRGIDVGARSEIYNVIKALTREGKTVIVVSSDMTEVLSICQRIIVMHEGKITGVLTGDDRTENEIMQFATNIKDKKVV